MPKPTVITETGIMYKKFTKKAFSKKDIERTKVKNMKYAFWDVSLYIEVFEKNGLVNGYKVSKLTSW